MLYENKIINVKWFMNKNRIIWTVSKRKFK